MRLSVAGCGGRDAFLMFKCGVIDWLGDDDDLVWAERRVCALRLKLKYMTGVPLSIKYALFKSGVSVCHSLFCPQPQKRLNVVRT